jgi:hypothetical protein
LFFESGLISDPFRRKGNKLFSVQKYRGGGGALQRL